jgi:hypothetical protein
MEEREEEVQSLGVWRGKNGEDGGGLDASLLKEEVQGVRKEELVPLSAIVTLLSSLTPTTSLAGVQAAFKKNLLGQVHQLPHHPNTDVGKEVQLHPGVEVRSREETQLNIVGAGDDVVVTAAREGMEHNG